MAVRTHSGQLIRRVTFRKPTAVQNDEGGSELSYEDEIVTYANVQELNQFRSSQLGLSLVDAKEFFIRWSSERDQIAVDWTIVFNSLTWVIHSIDNVDLKERFIRVTAKSSGVASTNPSVTWTLLPDGPGFGTVLSEDGTAAELDGTESFYQINLTGVGDSVISLKNNWRTVIDWGDGSPLMSYPNATIYKTYADQTALAIKVYYKPDKNESILFMQGGPNLNQPATAEVTSITGTLPPLTQFRIGYGLPEIPADFFGALYVDVEGAALDETELNDLIQLCVELNSVGTGRYLKLQDQTTLATPTNFTGIDLLLARQWEVTGYAAPTGATVSYDGTQLTFTDGNQNAETEVDVNGDITLLPVGTHALIVSLPAGGNQVSWRYIQDGTTTTINTEIITV
jgi:head-tail adaptor